MFDTDTAAAHREGLERSAKMLACLAQIGGGRVGTLLIDMNLQANGAPPMPADLRRYVQGPIICHDGNGWGPETNEGHPVHTPEYRNAIMEERQRIGLGVSPWIVGPCELSCVMYAASMAAPMGERLTNLYLWASCHLIKTVGRAYPGEFELITDEKVLKDPMYSDIYRRLAWDVRRKVVNVQAARELGERRQEREEAKACAAEDNLSREALAPIGEELDLFSALEAAE